MNIAGTRLAGADTRIIVAQDGSGDVTTISEALTLADDGDTVVVLPGTYTEAFVIDEDVTLIDNSGGRVRACVLLSLRHDPVSSFRDVWMRDDWPDRLRLGLTAEHGVDLVATDGEGKRVNAPGS